MFFKNLSFTKNMSIQFSKCFIKLIFFFNNNNNRNQNSSHFKIQNLNHSLNKYGLPYIEFEEA